MMLQVMSVAYFLMSVWFIYIKAGSALIGTTLIMSAIFYCGILIVDSIKKELNK